MAAQSSVRKGSPRQRGLSVLKTKLKAFYKDNKTTSKLSLNKMTLRYLKGKGPIKLRAKAGQARALVDFAVSLAREYSELDGEMGQHRFEAMQSFQVIHDLSAQDSLSEEDLVLWRRKAVEHMFHYACTGFHVVPKFHLLQHLPQHIRRSGVPRFFGECSGESKNKQAKGLWGKVSKGWATHEQVFERLMWLDALERIWLLSSSSAGKKYHILHKNNGYVLSVLFNNKKFNSELNKFMK